MVPYLCNACHFNVHYVQSADEEKGPVLVIHQPLLHFSPAKKNKKSEALQRCRGTVYNYVFYFTYVCIYVCMYACTCVCMYACTCVRTYICMNMCATYISMHDIIHTCICPYTHVHAHVIYLHIMYVSNVRQKNICTYVCVCVCIICVCVLVHLYI